MQNPFSLWYRMEWETCGQGKEFGSHNILMMGSDSGDGARLAGPGQVLCTDDDETKRLAQWQIKP